MQLPDLLRSKRFWSFIIGAIVMLITQLVPELSQSSDTLTEIIGVLVALLIGGYSLQDALLAKNGISRYVKSE